MTDKKKAKQDLAHGLREAVHGTQEFLYLERDEVEHQTQDHLERIEKELKDIEHAIHDASDSTKVAVSESLGFVRSKHAEALRRLQELKNAKDEAVEPAKQTLAEALSDLQHGVKHMFGGDE